LVYSRFDLHRRDDDDYLHFILYFWKYFDIHTQKKNGKISDVLFFVIVKNFFSFFFIFSLSLFPQLLYLNVRIFGREKTCRHRVIYSAFSQQQSRRRRRRRKIIGDWWWAVAWHLPPFWHLAPRASY
jgi:hypothetical protein